MSKDFRIYNHCETENCWRAIWVGTDEVRIGKVLQWVPGESKFPNFLPVVPALNAIVDFGFGYLMMGGRFGPSFFHPDGDNPESPYYGYLAPGQEPDWKEIRAFASKANKAQRERKRAERTSASACAD